MIDGIGDNNSLDYNHLFACLAEQIKLPLVQVSSMVEALDLASIQKIINDQKVIMEINQSALRLIDGFLLSVKLQRESQINLEPVSIGSLLYEVSESLYGYAKSNNCEIELDVANKCGLVMSHNQALKSALINLGYSFISASDKSSRRSIRLVANHNNKGITTGVFSDSSALTKSLFRNSKRIKGLAHQPMASFSSDNATGVFIADSLFDSIGSTMKVSKRSGNTGLVTTLLPSHQLSLV